MGRQQQQYDAVAGTNEEQFLNSTLDAGDWDDPHHSSFENPTVIKGVKQPTQCRDLWAAILFYIQLLTCITIACVYGVPAISRSSSSSSGDSHGSSRSSSNDDADDYEDYKGLLIGKKTESIIIYAYLALLEVSDFLSCSFHHYHSYIFPPTLSLCPFYFFSHTQKASLIAAIGAFTLSTLSLLLMSICPTFVIQLSLLCSLLWSAILAVCCFILLPYPTNVIGGCVCIVTLLLSLCYTLVIWKRIPFASMNLYTGIQAIKTNAGCILVVYGLVLLSIGYSLLWMTAVVGV